MFVVQTLIETTNSLSVNFNFSIFWCNSVKKFRDLKLSPVGESINLCFQYKQNAYNVFLVINSYLRLKFLFFFVQFINLLIIQTVVIYFIVTIQFSI